jgi:inner membrane protein
VDSITQITLGAAVGEAVLGKKLGGKAAQWGGLLGCLPDFDVLANPFVTEVQSLAIHRGFTHSILFAALAGPLTGSLLARLYPREPASWRAWSVLAFLAYITHALLDCFTTYGTQVFWPFSTYPVSFDSIFIIDPFYTVPLFTGLLWALLLPQNRVRRMANYAGLALSSGYLLFTLVNKQGVEDAFERALARKGRSYDQLLTTPSAFNNLLWMGVADDGRALWVGLHSVFDAPGSPIAFRRIDKHTERIEPYRGQLPLERLLWFSRGYFTVTENDEQRYFHDLRFGRTDGWLTDHGDYVFTFELLRDPAQPMHLTGFRQRQPDFEFSADVMRRLLDRIAGRPRSGAVLSFTPKHRPEQTQILADEHRGLLEIVASGIP